MLDLMIVVVFLVAGFLGYRKGLLRSLIGLMGNVIALLLSYFFARPVALFLDEKYQATAAIAGHIKGMLPIPDDFSNVVASIDGMAKLYAYLEDSFLPQGIKDSILNAVQHEVNTVGQGIFMTMADIIADSVAFSVLQGLTFIVLWFVLCLVLGLSSHLFAGLVHKIPVVGLVDRLGGLAVCVFLVGLTLVVLYSGISVLGLGEDSVFGQSQILALIGSMVNKGS